MLESGLGAERMRELIAQGHRLSDEEVTRLVTGS
jgi:hypothetical protein